MPFAGDRAPHASHDEAKSRLIRISLAALAGVLAWFLLVTACDIAVRNLWSEYAQVEKSLVFTLPMMIARLSESAVCSVLSGFLTAFLAKERIRSTLAAGVVLLALFLPVHISIWSKFPPWYHLVFLTSLPLLSLAGGLLRRSGGVSRPTVTRAALPGA